MAKNKHTFAKRQREMEKKLKAEEKRARRQKKKEETDATAEAPDESGITTVPQTEEDPSPLPGSG